MISGTALKAYRETFSNSRCFHLETSTMLLIEKPGRKGKTYRQPSDETEEQFLDRIERSKKAGRNLFYEEWPEFQRKKGCLY